MMFPITEHLAFLRLRLGTTMRLQCICNSTSYTKKTGCKKETTGGSTDGYTSPTDHIFK
eukprot:m.181305 g.181305  ORF g.181305 m.181305 type:complete len:59 (+) comp13585_c0_seq7:3991-4167(+)